jgi:cell division septal protein FtsQ
MSATETRRRQPANKPPAARFPFIWPFLALLACVAGLVAAFAGIFTVRQIDVIGSNLPRTAIAQVADVSGHNIFRVRSDAVVSRLGTIPQIIVQRVQTSFPDRVTIYARERIAMAAWRQSGGGLFLVDPNGRIISQVTSTNLPIIQGTAAGSKLGPGVVAAVRYAVQQLPGEPNGAIAGFRFDRGTGLTITGRTGWTADVGRGSPQTLTNRVATLAGFLVRIRNRPQQLKSVDLRYRSPYATFVGG